MQLVEDSAINRVCDDALRPLNVLQAILAGAIIILVVLNLMSGALLLTLSSICFCAS